MGSWGYVSIYMAQDCASVMWWIHVFLQFVHFRRIISSNIASATLSLMTLSSTFTNLCWTFSFYPPRVLILFHTELWEVCWNISSYSLIFSSWFLCPLMSSLICFVSLDNEFVLFGLLFVGILTNQVIGLSFQNCSTFYAGAQGGRILC